MDCPDCGNPLTVEVGPDHPLSASVGTAICAADVDEVTEVSRVCWTCGWHETRRIRVESVDTTAGDDSAVRRAALRDDIMDDVDAIDALGTLEAVHREVRRQRQLDQSGRNGGDAQPQ